MASAASEAEARDSAKAEAAEARAAAASATAAAAAGAPPLQGERLRSLVPVPPFTYDAFATLRAKAKAAAEEAAAASAGGVAAAQQLAAAKAKAKALAEDEGGAVVGGARGASLPRARSFVDSSQLPSVALRRSAVVGDPDALPLDHGPEGDASVPPGTRGIDGAPAIADLIASCLQVIAPDGPSDGTCCLYWRQ